MEIWNFPPSLATAEPLECKQKDSWFFKSKCFLDFLDKCRYDKSDLTQPGVLTVALLFSQWSWEVSLDSNEKDKEVKQFKKFWEINFPSKIGELTESDTIFNLF